MSSATTLDADKRQVTSWEPEIGPLTETLIANQELDDESCESLKASAIRTLGRCAAPGESGEHRLAHLVVGEVQSGKTLAFTALMALARDNGFRLIIVIAGTKNNLLEQTFERLDRDLFAGEGGLNPWDARQNPGPDDADLVSNVITKRSNPEGVIDGSQTAVCFVLKNKSRLKALVEMLHKIGPGVLAATPTLIIDDEADQASLNLSHSQGRRSPTYGVIGEVRAALPLHDFLMYTATPQGPLLVELDDELSPSTVTVLESVPAYVGGSDLFIQGHGSYVRNIPAYELEAALEPDGPSAAPPQSLRRSIATFLLALVIAQGRENPRPLSMLIHPAAARDLHHTYAIWAKAIKEELLGKLDDAADVLFEETVNADLLQPYKDLAATIDQIPPLTELAKLIPPFGQQVEVREVNQGRKSEEITRSAWGKKPGWILVGGNKLERGFTVENLAITYMPRGPGMKHADTIQQRGRFFGYKRGYLDLCRGWFTEEISSAFSDYVEHEQAMHDALRDLDSSSQPLRSWRRELLLSPTLRPTRKQVISLLTTRHVLTSKDGWFGQGHLFDPGIAEVNTELARRLLETYRSGAIPDPRDPRGRHCSTTAHLADIHRVLVNWEAVSSDSKRLLGISLVIDRMLEDELASKCQLVFMDGFSTLDDMEARRQRQAQQSEGPTKSVEIFQGSDAGTGYPGDREIRDGELVTIQFHLLDLFERDGSNPLSGVPAVAVHLPTSITTLILQDQA